jgi:hypothetical protein
MQVPDGEKSTIEQYCREKYSHLFNKPNSFSVAWGKGCPELFKSVSHESRTRKGNWGD